MSAGASTSTMSSEVSTIQHAGRSCTDVACAVMLAVFLYGLWVSYGAARREGNLAKLTHGFDWKGDICGVDPGVEDKPLLFWCAPGQAWDLRLLDGICVDRCPQGIDTSSWCPGRAVPFERDGAVDELGQREVIVGMARNLTRRVDYATVPAFGYCFPSQDTALMQRILKDTHVSTMSRQIFLACHGALESWHFLIVVAVACVVIGYLFLAVLWLWFAQLLYGLALAAHALLAVCCYAAVTAALDEEHNFFAHYASPTTASLLAWSCAGAAVATWILFSALCWYGRSAAGIAIDSVRATCEVLAHLPTILLQPLVHSAVVLAAVLTLLYGLAWVVSTGKVVPLGSPIREGGVEIQGLQRNIEFTGWQWACVIYWIFGLVWVCETLSALGQFALSHAVAIYACLGKVERVPLLHGYIAGLRFHLGTLALGGFAIGCLKVIAAVLWLVVRQGSGQGGASGAVAQLCCCCCLACVACVERLLAMVNDLIYTDVALHGWGYMEAAAQVVRVTTSSPGTYAAIKGSATAIRVVGVTTIGGVGTLLSYQALSSSKFHTQLDGVFDNASSIMATSNILGATVAAGFVCFYVAIAFMMVFYQTTHALMYCMLTGAMTLDEDHAGSCRDVRSPREEA